MVWDCMLHMRPAAYSVIGRKLGVTAHRRGVRAGGAVPRVPRLPAVPYSIQSHVRGVCGRWSGQSAPGIGEMKRRVVASRISQRLTYLYWNRTIKGYVFHHLIRLLCYFQVTKSFFAGVQPVQK